MGLMAKLALKLAKIDVNPEHLMPADRRAILVVLSESGEPERVAVKGIANAEVPGKLWIVCHHFASQVEETLAARIGTIARAVEGDADEGDAIAA